MKIQRIHSIQEIYEVIQTNGSMPVRVMCSDMEEFICKYQSPNFNPLVKELVSQSIPEYLENSYTRNCIGGYIS